MLMEKRLDLETTICLPLLTSQLHAKHPSKTAPGHHEEAAIQMTLASKDSRSVIPASTLSQSCLEYLM